jgi:hypothetical protein
VTEAEIGNILEKLATTEVFWGESNATRPTAAA